MISEFREFLVFAMGVAAFTMLYFGLISWGVVKNLKQHWVVGIFPLLAISGLEGVSRLGYYVLKVEPYPSNPPVIGYLLIYIVATLFAIFLHRGLLYKSKIMRSEKKR